MWVRVARVGRPFGLAGAVSVQCLTDEPELRFAPGVLLATADDGSGPVTVRSARQGAGRWILHLDGSADRDAAEALRGTILHAQVSDAFEPAGPDEWYDRDLVGLVCRDPDGDRIGVVTGVAHLPAHDALEVRTDAGHQALVPLVAQIVTAVGRQGVVVRDPGGLLDPVPAQARPPLEAP